MVMKKTDTPVTRAYTRCKPGRSALLRVGQLMETLEDEAGVIVERYCMPDGTSLVLFATPHWWDVYVSLTTERDVPATVEKIDEYAKACAARQALRGG